MEIENLEELTNQPTKSAGLSELKKFALEKIIELILLGSLFFFITYSAQKSYTDYTIDLENASHLFSEFTELANRRLFRTRRLFNVYKSPDQHDEDHKFKLKKYREEYWNILEVWNSKLSQNSLLLDMRFGKHFKKTYEVEIHEGFRVLHSKLYEVSKSVQKNNLHNDTIKIDQFNIAFYEFADRLTLFYVDLKSAIDEEKIGRNKEDFKIVSIDSKEIEQIAISELLFEGISINMSEKDVIIKDHVTSKIILTIGEIKSPSTKRFKHLNKIYEIRFLNKYKIELDKLTKTVYIEMKMLSE